MPLYDYKCSDCGAVFETRLTVSEVDNAQPICPRCGGSHVRRKINRVALKRSHSSGYLTSDQMNAAAGFADTFGGPSGESHEHHHEHGEPHEHHEH